LRLLLAAASFLPTGPTAKIFQHPLIEDVRADAVIILK